MDVKTVREKLELAIKAPEDDNKYRAYVSEYTLLLDEVKITADTVNIAIAGISLDQGVNFLDTFAALDKKEVQDAWKTIRNSEAYKSNIDYNALKLMSSFVASALGGDINTSSILGNIITALVASSDFTKEQKGTEEVYAILRTYVLGMLSKDVKLPDWKKIKSSPENVLNFCKLMIGMIELGEMPEQIGNYPAAFAVKKWASDGVAFAEETIEIKEREKNKPPKKSEELLKLVEHFKAVEVELDKTIYESAKLALEKKKLEENLYSTESKMREFESRIKELEQEIQELNSKVNQANQEVDERKKLNEAQVQYRENTQVSLLQDIARALKAEYGDYAETKELPMNEMLGEIYREKLKQIFKILEQKGIKVEG